jgi:hypothetical protein
MEEGLGAMSRLHLHRLRTVHDPTIYATGGRSSSRGGDNWRTFVAAKGLETALLISMAEELGIDLDAEMRRDRATIKADRVDENQRSGG